MARLFDEVPVFRWKEKDSQHVFTDGPYDDAEKDEQDGESHPPLDVDH